MPTDPDLRERQLRREYGLDKEPAGASQLFTAGAEFAGIFLVLALGGWWLDKTLGSSPWLLVIGILVGMTGGMYRLVKRFMPPAETRK